MEYAFEFQGKTFTPEGIRAITDPDLHNKVLEAKELAHWATCPDRWQVYVATEATGSSGDVTTWLGTPLNKGRVAHSRFRTNISRNMVAIRFTGTNGAEYYGRYGADWSQLCRVRKVKSKGRK